MISKEFVTELSKLNSISDKVVLKYPITTINSEAIDMLVNIKADALGCTEFQDTGIYNLSKFVNMFKLFENPEIIRTENSIEFKTPGTKAVFTLSDLDIMKDFNQKSSLISSLDSFPSVTEVNLNANTIKQFKSASSILDNLNALVIEAKDSATELYLATFNRFNSTNNTYKQEFLGTSSKNFKLMISVDNFNKLPITDYILKVKYNEEKDAYRILFESSKFCALISRLQN